MGEIIQMLTYEQYCQLFKISDKDNLTDEQILQYANNSLVGFDNILRVGSDDDRKQAIILLRRAIKTHKKFQCGHIIDGDSLDGRRFTMWLE